MGQQYLKNSKPHPGHRIGLTTRYDSGTCSRGCHQLCVVAYTSPGGICGFHMDPHVLLCHSGFLQSLVPHQSVSPQVLEGESEKRRTFVPCYEYKNSEEILQCVWKNIHRSKKTKTLMEWATLPFAPYMKPTKSLRQLGWHYRIHKDT